MPLFKSGQRKVRRTINEFRRDRTGTALIEYAFVLSLLAGIVTVAFPFLGTATGNLLGYAQTAMTDVAGGINGGDSGAGGGSGGGSSGGGGSGGHDDHHDDHHDDDDD